MSAHAQIVVRAQQFKALSNFEWKLDGVSALVGPNGSGKSTALSIVEALRRTLADGYGAGVELFGSGPLAPIGRPQGTQPWVELCIGDAKWRRRMTRSGSEYETVRLVSPAAPEGEDALMRIHERGWNFRSPEGAVGFAAVAGESGLRGALSAVKDGRPSFRSIERLAAAVQRSRLFRRPDLPFLRENGSAGTRVDELDLHARDLFTVLRTWRDRSEFEHRLTFVEQHMKELFPTEFVRFDFEQVAQRTSALVRVPGSTEKLAPTDWSDGFFTMLVHLTALASVDAEGLVAIDEPENSLHPGLIRDFVEICRDWSRERGCAVALATHSPVVLDQFKAEPERVFVMEPGKDVLPVPLDVLRKREWLQHYALGDLYSHSEVGARP